MQPNNPACYECTATKSGIHTWTRRDDGTSWCIKCQINLTVEQTADVWRGWNTKLMTERHTGGKSETT